MGAISQRLDALDAALPCDVPSAAMAPPALSDAAPFLRATLGAAPFAVGPSYAFHSLTCSRDGALVAGIGGRTAWIARTSDGVVLRRVHGPSLGLATALLSPDGATLYTVGDRSIVAWNVADGATRFVIDRPLDRPVATLTPDGSRLIVDTKGEVIAIDAATGAIGATAPRSKAGVGAPPICTADGELVALLGRGLLRVDRDLHTTAEIDPDREFARACAVGTAKRIVAASGRLLALIDLGDAQMLAHAEAPGEVHALLAHGDTLWVVHAKTPGAYEWLLAPYDAATLRPREGVARTALPQRVSVGAVDDALWIAHDGSLLRRRLDAGGDLRNAFAARGDCTALRFDPKAEHLCATMGTYSTRVSVMRVSLASGERLVRDLRHVKALAFTREADGVIVGTHAEGARRYDFDPSSAGEVIDAEGGASTLYATGAAGRVVAIDESPLNALRVLPDGARWPLPPKHRLGYMPAWHVDEELVTAHDLKRITVFDLRAGAYLEAIKVPSYRKLCWVPGGAWIANDKRAQRWDLRARKVLDEVKFEVPPWSVATSIAATRDGRLLAVGTSLGAVVLMELDGAARSVVFSTGGDGLLSACAFSDDGALLATGCAEPTLRVWDVARLLAAAPSAATPAKAKRGAKA